MSGKKLENELVEHCAPTLAGLKSAGLFRYFYEDKEKTRKEVQQVNELLNERGVYVEALLWDKNSALIYTYRFRHLQKELEKADTRKLLEEYGYDNYDVESCICHLKARLRNYTCFPHEIGIFLGYPLADVKGFIENNGQNCKCCGMWKVYCNETETEKLFQKLKKCSEIYLKVFLDGRNLMQLTVCS